jgi:2-polyprenyl-6-methoxyphenol hydroxylase-like FAD-dependent oxidoreductase
MEFSGPQSTTQVVVVGAGPTGLMLAGELKLAGVDVVVAERRPTGTVGESRAPGIQARTMEVFEQRGLHPQFLDRGRVMPAVLFSGIAMYPGQFDPEWPTGLILAQHETERSLGGWAAELGVPILWSTEVVDVRPEGDGVDVVVDGESGPKTLRAEFVVGCDGGRSAVRKACAIPFAGDDAVSHWLVADARLDSPPDGGVPFGRNERIGSFQISRTEPDWFRLSLITRTPPSDRTVPVSLEELRGAMLDGLGTDYGLREARWMSRFSDATRQAAEYRRGRALLAGDAAHTHTPIGGQGLNLGIQDAVNLGWKLAAVIHGEADSLLDTYHRERHTVAQTMLQWTQAQTALIKPGKQIDAMRGVMADLLGVPDVATRLGALLSGLGLQYPLSGTHPLIGRRMPNLSMTTSRGVTSVFGLLHQARHVLLNFGSDGLTAVPAPWTDRVDYVDAQLDIAPSEGSWRLPVFGSVPAVNAVLIRPDGYVSWVNPDKQPADLDALTVALTTWLRPQAR